MTSFPAPPAAAIAEAIEKTGTAEWIDTLDVLDLDRGSPREIRIVPRRYPDRPDEAREMDDVLPLCAELLPWAREMAGLFRIFSLTSFNVVIRDFDCRLENWTPPRPLADTALDSGRLWAAQRRLETEIASSLVQEHGEAGFHQADLVISTDDRPPALLSRRGPSQRFRRSRTPDAAQEWRRAMSVWLQGIHEMTLRIVGRPLSAHERLEIMRRAASTSSGRVA